MADNILDQLRAYEAARDASKRTADEILRERNLLKEVSSLAKRINVEFDSLTKNIGKSVDNLELGYRLQEKLRQSTGDRASLENNLIAMLKQATDVEKNYNELARINSLTIADRNDEYFIEQANLDAKLAGGEIEASQHQKISDLLLERYTRTAEIFSKEVLSANRLSQQVLSTKDLLNSEDKRLAKLTIQNKFLNVGKKVLSDMGPIGSAVTGAFNASKMNPWILAAQMATAILEKGYENFKAFDKAAVDVRKNLGALPGQANVLENRLKTVTIDMMHLGATFDDVAKSINEIANEFTGLVAQDTNLLKTTTALAKQFGIAEGTSVKFLKTLGGISGNSASSQRSMIGFAQKIAQASGVPLGKIMEDVASASDDVRIYVGSSAVSMIKAAAAARMMGIDINKAATSAEKLLNFESSIASELKASALLGQNINFNYARQLFFNKNIIGANKEILRLTKQVNFNQLDPIKQKAFADAAGKSVGELQDMLQQEKNIQLVRNGTNDKAKKALADYERMMQLKDEEAKNEGKIAEQQILQRANQEKLAQIQNKFNQLMSELAEPVMEVLDGFLTIATELLPYIKFALIPIVGVTMLFSKYIVGIGTQLATWGRAMSIFGTKFLSIGKIIGTVAKFAGSFIKIFGTKIPVIGQIISALLFIRNYIRDLKRMFEEGGTWGEMIVKGLLLIPKAIVEAFLPFDSIKKKLDEWFFGKSPSKAGKLIAKGFSSIGPELQDSLVTPVNKAYDEIKNISPPEIKVTGGFSSIGSKLQDSLITSVNKAYDEIKNISPPEINVDSATTNKLVETTDNTLISVIKTSNQQLVSKIDQLMTMMANGGIAVNLDGQRINAALSTTMLKSGGFGQATTRA